MAGSQDASSVASKWARNLLANKESAIAGANRVTIAPTELAAKQVDRYASGCAEAASSGRFERGCRKVSLSDWQEAYIKKGIPNMATGVKMGESKMATFMTAYLPFIQAKSAEIRRMPKGTRSDAMARIAANLDAQEQFKMSRGRG